MIDSANIRSDEEKGPDDESNVTLLTSKIVRDGDIQVRVPVRSADDMKIPGKKAHESENTQPNRKL